MFYGVKIVLMPSKQLAEKVNPVDAGKATTLLSLAEFEVKVVGSRLHTDGERSGKMQQYS